MIFQTAALKVFLQLGQSIEEDEKLNNNHFYFTNDTIHARSAIIY